MASRATSALARPDSSRPARSGTHQLPAIDYEQHPGAATAPLAHRQYQRHEPEKTVLYAVVQENLETFLARPCLHGGPGYPRYIEREFRHYLDCGLLAHG